MKRLATALMFCALPLAAQVKIEKAADETVTIGIDGKPFTTFYYGPQSGHPYLHPLRAADGTIVTRHFPMEKVEGESTDHQHHRGLWFGHFLVNGDDFWSNEKDYKTKNRGNIVLKSIDDIKNGTKQGSLTITMDWLDHTGTAILREKRVMTFYSGETNRMMDLDFTLTPLTSVTFTDNKDGVLGIRLAAALEEKDKKSLPNPPRTGEMVGADGCRTEKNCWGTTSQWMDYHGDINGEKLGLAILASPANKRPTYWHARGYGLFAANIFGVKEFTKDETKDGSMTIKPGDPLRFQYRVIIHPGDEKTAGIAAEYTKYAK